MIKVTLGAETPKKEKPFPKLMIRKNYEDFTIIYATSEDGKNNLKGVCIASDYKMGAPGKYMETWNRRVFTDYNEPITLQNA